ncbi:hypothetical protein E2C01_064893 [Portunus trituberculatus]|uniref:Uncharacterized protein n=1 Tax=Portunus trituberculatus TaxID=210409 RepID=A0A5B7HPM7_PORTR|nr:hypothetical protein [Portunus trituberculatus]
MFSVGPVHMLVMICMSVVGGGKETRYDHTSGQDWFARLRSARPASGLPSVLANSSVKTST